MPIYQYKCNACDHEFDVMSSFADKQNPESEPCPNCGKQEIKACITAPNMSHLGTKSVHARAGGFNEVLRKIKKSSGKNNTIRSK